MNEIWKILISLGVLLLGIPIGDLLARATKEELKSGRKWFYLILVISFIGGIVGLIIGKDWLMFTLFFIAIVSSRSLK